MLKRSESDRRRQTQEIYVGGLSLRLLKDYLGLERNYCDLPFTTTDLTKRIADTNTCTRYYELIVVLSLIRENKDESLISIYHNVSMSLCCI